MIPIIGFIVYLSLCYMEPLIFPGRAKARSVNEIRHVELCHWLKKLLEAIKKGLQHLGEEIALLKVIAEIVIQVLKLDGDNILFDFLGTPINMIVEVSGTYYYWVYIPSIWPTYWTPDRSYWKSILWSPFK